jgi:putative oxygen-independent coproporphyrinogen III oxidase
VSATAIRDLSQFLNSLPTSAYLHIPFCRRRCFYCDFPVSVVGDRKDGSNSGTIQHYIEVLQTEICTTSQYCQEIFGVSLPPLKTIFFGGGTPSLLSISQVQRLLETLDQQFGITTQAEISMEMDPGTFTLEQVKGYQKAGINRISLGVQAFQDELLIKSGRSHSVAEIWQAAELLNQANIDNVSIDLISGLPHQTLEMWQFSLESAISMSPAHLSSYDLIVEPKTPFFRYYQPGKSPLPTDETAAQMYRMAQQMLTNAGYQHYEISNYAKPGYQCRHNQVYWHNQPYYGFGMGATSYIYQQRVMRPRKTWEYYEWVPTEKPFKLSQQNQDNLTETTNDQLLETLMLGFRLSEGIDLSKLAEQFGEEILKKLRKCLQPYDQQGWVKLIDDDGMPVELLPNQSYPSSGKLRLSDPEGFLFSNTILAELFNQFSDL